MAGNDRHQVPFRLTSDHLQRLDKAARQCGLTRQAFVQAAVLGEIAEVEERVRMKKLRTRPAYEPAPESDADPAPSQPTSGLIEALRQRERAAAPPKPSSVSPQGQVVVNVGANGPQGELVHRLAAYVLAVNDFEREVRMRNAVDILRANSTSEEEQRVLAARLDEAIAAATKTGQAGENGLVRGARFAFDKIANFLGGEEK